MAEKKNDPLDWAGTTPSDEGLAGLDPVVAEAKKRFNRAMKWTSQARTRYIQDTKFAQGDSDNFYQWPNEIRRNRDTEAEPCLTINKTRQHNLQIINDAKQNKPGIKVAPVGNGATFEAAKVLNNLFRHIEQRSGATYAYMHATKCQVEGGLGWFRVLTDYVDEWTFDQELKIEPIPDPLTVVSDPDCKYQDRRDAMWGIVFDDVERSQFLEQYPEYRHMPPAKGALGKETDWINQDKVRVAEYYRIDQTRDELLAYYEPPYQERKHILESELELLPPEMKEQIRAAPGLQSRPVLRRQLEWYKIVGEEIKEHRKLPGKYIPLVPVIGEESVIEGQYDCKGHTRALKDPQRIYNYYSSTSVQVAALQPKTPYLAPVLSIEGLETYWDDANTTNPAILPFNHLDDDGNQIPPPQRQQPPTSSDACLKGLQIAGQEMMMVSGQYQAMMGEQGNERSAKAISERQRQGDNSTYGYIDNLGLAVTQCARICLDLIPFVYDVKRVVSIQGEDGTSQEVEIDPDAKAAYQQNLDHEGKVAKLVLNPRIGQYWVTPDMGPSWATKRQEASNAFHLIMAENPAVAQLVGDLYFSNLDFDGAETAAERFRHMLPPQASGKGPSQAEQQLQQQLQLLTQEFQKTQDENAKLKIELKGKDQMRDIDGYEAETKRISAMAKMLPQDAQGMKALIHQLVGDSLQTHITNIQAQNAATDQTQQQAATIGQSPQISSAVEPPPVPGARKAPDGQWYVQDPTRGPGHYARVRGEASPDIGVPSTGGGAPVGSPPGV